MYTILYLGNDGTDQVEYANSFEEGLKTIAFVEERGAHSISMYDPGGEEVIYG